MANVTLSNTSDRVVSKVQTVNSPSIRLIPIPHSAKVSEISNNLSSIDQIDFSKIDIAKDLRSTKAESILPFRVSFSSITIEGYSASRPAPVGIAVIGVNNYIL